MNQLDFGISQRAVSWLKENSLPYSDTIDRVCSNEKFDAGGIYGVEIPIVNSLSVLEKTIHFLKKENVYCTRFNETHGAFLLSDQEIVDMLSLCRENSYGMLLSIGPRPEYDPKSSFYRSKFGLELGRQLNNNDAFTFAIEEAIRLSELGCRGLIVYDIGVLRVLGKMRSAGILPHNMIFKASSHCMVSNPLIGQVFKENGADSVTLTHDLGISVIQEIRRLNPGLVLDVPIDVYKTKGGYIRFYEAAEIVQIGSPVILKMGASSQGDPYDAINDQIILSKIRRVSTGLEYLNKSPRQLSVIGEKSIHRCLPSLISHNLMESEKSQEKLKIMQN